MKKVLSYLLYTLFFAFATVLIITCVVLIINKTNKQSDNYNQIEAVIINKGEDTAVSEYENISEMIINNSKYYNSVSNNYGYDALETDEEQYLYEKISSNIYKITSKTDENGHYRTERLKISGVRMSENSIRKVVNAFSFDNPQVFWLENLFGYAYAENDTIVEFYSVLSPRECEKYIKKFTTAINNILSEISDGLSEYEREQRIHDIILEKCEYKTGVTSSSDGWQYFSPYGALVGGEAVCEGYAKSMQILLSRVGIESYVIRGEGEGIGHMWNVVKLGGEWYHLDPTWDDSGEFISYEYFNVDTETINKNHTINDDIKNIDIENVPDETRIRYNFFVPICTSMDMNYYNVEGYLLKEFDKESDEAVINAIINAINNNRVYLPLRFGNKMTYTEYIDMMFYKSPYKFYYYIQQANERLDKNHQIDKESVSVLKNETTSTIRIKLNIINNE